MADVLAVPLERLPQLLQALEAMRARGLESDSRYKQLQKTAEELQKKKEQLEAEESVVKEEPKASSTPVPSPPPTTQANPTSTGDASSAVENASDPLAPSRLGTITIDVTTVTRLTPEQITQLRAQIAAYQYLVASQPIPELLLQAVGQPPVPSPTPQQPLTLQHRPKEEAPKPQEQPQRSTDQASQQSSRQLSVTTDTVKVSSPKPLSPATAAVKKKPVAQPKPPKLFPNDAPKPLPRAQLAKEREHILAAKMKRRITFLEGLLPSDNLQLMTELHALRLLELQNQVREEVRQLKLDEPGLDAQALKPSRRSKKKELQKAQEKLQQQRLGHEKHMEFVTAILQHAGEFRAYHRAVSGKTAKLAKAVLMHHTTTEREQKKESDRLEKERMRRLMAEDEEGYRKLIDQQKDRRLAFLLDQTDEFIEQLTDLVKKHKLEQRAMRRQQRLVSVGHSADDSLHEDTQAGEDNDPEKAAGVSQDALGASEADARVAVVETSTGTVLAGQDAPLKSELKSWLEENPGYAVRSPQKSPMKATPDVALGEAGDQKPSADQEVMSDSDLDISDDDGESEGSDGGEDEESTETAEAMPSTCATAASESAADGAGLSTASASSSGQLVKLRMRKRRRSRLRKRQEQSEAAKAADGKMDMVDEYQDTSASKGSTATKNSTYFLIAHQHKEKITSQPEMLVGGTLKEYQLSGLEWLVSLYNNNLNGILADEMGLGKTIQTIATICYLVESKNLFGPYLIIVPLSTLSNWALELDKWAPSIVKIIYKGAPAVRKVIAHKVRTTRFNILLTTYEYVMKDRTILGKISWKHMVIDEGHRMKNHHCKLTTTINQYYSTSHRLILSGTPLQNSLPEMWALLNFLLPSIFHSVTTFEQWFNAPFENIAEKHVELNKEETMLIIRRLHQVLRPFLLRRLKKEVESQLPDKAEYILRCDMSALQKRMYQHMKSMGVILTDGSEQNKKGKGGTKTLMNTIVQLRKICNHPFLFQNMEEAFSKHLGWHGAAINGPNLFRVAGKFELLDRILPKLEQTGHRVLLFCQMTSCMTILEDYLAGAGCRYLRLDGGTKADDRGELLALFNAAESPYFIFLLSTRAGGLGLNLQTADTVIIFDSDWNPHQDLQAQDRAHRIGQKNEVRVLRLITIGTVEEQILAAARYKLNMDEKVIQAGMFDQKSTGVERRVFLEALLFEEEENEEEDDVPDDDVINQMISRSADELVLFQAMDAERLGRNTTDAYWSQKSRLVEDHELPVFLLKDMEEVERLANEEEEEKLYGHGVRQRNEVDYSEYLTDKQWVKAVEDGKLDEVETKVRDRKRKHKDDEPEEVNVMVPEKPEKPEKKKKKPNKSAAKVVPNPPMLTKQMLKIVALVEEYKNEEGRILSEIFYQLPTRSELRDYYDIIKTPIDIRRIKDRIGNHKYRSIAELDKDCILMFSNARIYNMEGSIIYEDSIVLEAVYTEARDDVISGVVTVSMEDEEERAAATVSASSEAAVP